jgi:hypothetical protein
VKYPRGIFCYADVGCYLNIFRLVIAIRGVCTFIFTNLLFCLYVFCHVEGKFLLRFLSLHEQQRPTLFAHSLNFLSLRKISSFCRLCNTAMSYWTTRRITGHHCCRNWCWVPTGEAWQENVLMESWFLSDYEGEYCHKSLHVLLLIPWTRKQYVVPCTEFIVPFYFHVLGGWWWNLLGMSWNKYASHPIYSYKVKVKCTLVEALRLCTGRTAHRWSRGIALL